MPLEPFTINDYVNLSNKIECLEQRVEWLIRLFETFQVLFRTLDKSEAHKDNFEELQILHKLTCTKQGGCDLKKEEV